MNYLQSFCLSRRHKLCVTAWLDWAPPIIHPHRFRKHMVHKLEALAAPCPVALFCEILTSLRCLAACRWHGMNY
jgi:hypothetical protein